MKRRASRRYPETSPIDPDQITTQTQHTFSNKTFSQS